MSLADFIRRCSEEIVAHSVEFARSIKPLANATIDVDVLRDHLPLVLSAIALDLDKSQTQAEGIAKSEGLAPVERYETAAQTHGRLRAESGLSVDQVVAEYRVLRAVVVRLWSEKEKGLQSHAIRDLVRFNEAIDQAIAESVAFHSAEAERWRDMLVAVIGHDLRGPLQALMATSEVLSSKLRDTASKPHIDLLQRGIERLSVLLDSLLDYSRARLGSGMRITRSATDIAEVCRAELELLRASLRDINIEFATTGPCRGTVDANRIREALSNLVSNAAQYGLAGTPLQVTVAGDERNVTISVVNEGEPIPHELLQTFFEPLRRRDAKATRGPRRNLGIGLFVVREIAKAHGGSVDAEASAGKVSFVICLPKTITSA